MSRKYLPVNRGLSFQWLEFQWLESSGCQGRPQEAPYPWVGLARSLSGDRDTITELGRRFWHGYLGIHRTPPDADGRHR